MRSIFYLLKRWASRAPRAAAPIHFSNVTSEIVEPFKITNATTHPL